MQFTIRGTAIATLCMGVCFGAFCLAKSATSPPNGSGSVPASLFVLAVLALCAAALALFKELPVGEQPPRAKAFAWTIVAWNAATYVLILAYPHTVGWLVFKSYEAQFGSVQASYGTFSRVYALLENILVTLPATVFALWLFGALSKKPWKWQRAATIIGIWQAMIVLMHTGSSELAFPYSLN
jgi:hypothetical protein